MLLNRLHFFAHLIGCIEVASVAVEPRLESIVQYAVGCIDQGNATVTEAVFVLFDRLANTSPDGLRPFASSICGLAFANIDLTTFALSAVSAILENVPHDVSSVLPMFPNLLESPEPLMGLSFRYNLPEQPNCRGNQSVLKIPLGMILTEQLKRHHCQIKPANFECITSNYLQQLCCVLHTSVCSLYNSHARSDFLFFDVTSTEPPLIRQVPLIPLIIDP
jgi:hypothetical protein